MNLVMFDIDGTLTASNDLDEEAYLQALSEVFGFAEVSSDRSDRPIATPTLTQNKLAIKSEQLRTTQTRTQTASSFD